ncbi:MAG TPA: SDR family NAD(P)-dependent oxidoreductase [Anaerolineae bacterium]|nr:SDR family NAD(P)-dependent oxidoreductase [Anaerolineae bacterium]
MMKKKLLFGALLAGGVVVWKKVGQERAEVSLVGKVAIVTGASAGIGEATAHALARAGATVVLVARRAEELARVAGDLERYDRPMMVCVADVTDDGSLVGLVERVVERFGRIDILVNNAGLSMGGPFAEHDARYMRKMVEVNVYGLLRMTQLVVPIMKRQGGGHIVNVSSVAAILPIAGQTAYASTRMAVIAFSNALRRELMGSGVFVSVVLPGWTKTGMMADMDEDKLRESGLINPLVTVDEAVVPAEAIVDVIRYRRRKMVLGGIQIKMGAFFDLFSTHLVDWLLLATLDRDKSVEVLRDLG